MCKQVEIAVLVSFFWLFPADLFAQSYGCDSNHVSQNGGALVVSATGVDDTDNIQCALDAAKANGIPTVRLQKGEYGISHVQINNFNGTFEGTTRDDTVLVVLNNSIDCDALIDAGQAPAGIKFINSDARVRYMTYGAETPCVGSQPDVFFLIHFTGGNAFSGCGNDTGFGIVDRVNLVSIAEIMPGIRGVGVGAEGVYFGTCKDTLLGTFKLNRSLLGFFRVAVQLGIRASGQVDVNFNEFADNAIAIGAINASQLLTVQENVIVRSEDVNFDNFGVALLTNETNAPATNRMVLHNNDFGIDEGFNTNVLSIAVFAGQDMTIANVSLVATNNDFLFSGGGSWGFVASDISNGIFVNNDLQGIADLGFYLEGEDTTSRDWSVVGNSFGGLSSGTADIFLNTGTTRTIIGPGQGATVSNFGAANTILSSGGGSQKPTGRSSTQATVEKANSLPSRMHRIAEKIARQLNSEKDGGSPGHNPAHSPAEQELSSNATLTEKLELIAGSGLRKQ